MFEVIAAHLQALPLAVQLIGVAILLSVVDFALAVIAHLRAGDFHGTILADWLTTKGLPIVVVALLFGLDAVLTLVPIDVGGTDLGAFGMLASAQVITFIAQEAFSILKNAKMLGNPPPAEDPVPEE